MYILLILPILAWLQTTSVFSYKQLILIETKHNLDVEQISHAEQLGSNLNKIENINIALSLAAASCSIAEIAPPVAASIKAAAELSAKAQDLLARATIASSKILALKSVSIEKGSSFYRGPPIGFCKIPAPLKWNKYDKLVFKHTNKESGFCLNVETYKNPKWHFCRGLL